MTPKRHIKHPIIILKQIRSEKDVIFGKGTTVDLDRLTLPILKLLRREWNIDPLSLGGDIIYLFNKNLPNPISEEELDSVAQ